MTELKTCSKCGQTFRNAQLEMLMFENKLSLGVCKDCADEIVRKHPELRMKDCVAILTEREAKKAKMHYF